MLERWQADKVFERSLEQSAGNPTWIFYEGPPTANGTPGAHHVEARVFKDVFPRFKTMKGYHVPPQGRLGLPRPAGRARGGEGARLHRQAGHRGVRRSPSSTPAAASRCCGTSTSSSVMTERMGYWVDIDDAVPDDGPGLRRVASGGRSSRSSTRACWSRTTGSRRTARAAGPACPTTSWPRATRPSSTRRCTCASRSPPDRWPSGRRATCWSGRPRRGRWCPTPRSRSTRDVDLRRRAQPDGGRARGRRAAAGRGARRGRREVLDRFPGRDAGALRLPPAVRPGRRSRERALRGPGRLRHHRGRHRAGAPGPRVRRRGPRRRAARTGCRWSTRSARTARSAPRSPLVGGHVLQGRRRRRWSPTCASAGCCSAQRAVRARVPALLALPHRRCSTTRCRPGTSAPPRSRTAARARTSGPTGTRRRSSTAGTATG